MLKRLSLENVAIVDALTVSFEDGFTVITGETGAGKSILLESIGLVFGEKTSPKDVLRTGTDRARIELTFDIPPAEISGSSLAIRNFLKTHEVELLPDETEVLVSREFTETSSRCRINGAPVSRDVLCALRPLVLDLHGQHELTSLFQPEAQRECLDRLGGDALRRLKDDVKKTYFQWLGIKQKLAAIQEKQEAFERQQEFLRFQIAEIEEARLSDPNEDELLKQTLEKLKYTETLLKITGEAGFVLASGEGDTPSVSDTLASVQKKLSQGEACDPEFATFTARLSSLQEELKNFAKDLTRYHDGLTQEPELLEQTVDRLDLLEKLKRKYGPTLGNVLEKHAALSEELQALALETGSIEVLEKELKDLEIRLNTVSTELSAQRKHQAEVLTDCIQAELVALAMPNARFEASLQATDPASNGGFTADGRETVTFLFSANPGEPVKPLAKVASGGELSRVLLALKVVTARQSQVRTLLFDEIDTGISGKTVKAVAEKMTALSEYLQILAITHQPITAVMGKHHLHVEKTIPAEGGIRVNVVSLEEKEKRLNVLSRLASGIDTDDEAVENFVTLLMNQAASF